MNAVVVQARAQTDVKSSVSWQKNVPVSVCNTHKIQAGRCDVASAQVRIRKPIIPSLSRTHSLCFPPKQRELGSSF